MEDRSVEFPQRYQLKKVEGTDDIYDLVPAPGTIAKEGTLINKSALLKDETVALFKGLPGNPVPDEVFHILSKAVLLGEDGGLFLPNGNGVTSVKIIHGSYIGKGTHGKANKTSISLPSDPLFFALCNKAMGFKLGNEITGLFQAFMYTPGLSSIDVYGEYNKSGTITISFSEEDKTLSWFSANYTECQCNVSGKTYLYVAIYEGS